MDLYYHNIVRSSLLSVFGPERDCKIQTSGRLPRDLNLCYNTWNIEYVHYISRLIRKKIHCIKITVLKIKFKNYLKNTSKIEKINLNKNSKK